ncbi:MAG: hypothetical protein KY433_04045, partial [Actinobacteria bacterium]|nr:hypothetical protein [Actinomycetota bacterium]
AANGLFVVLLLVSGVVFPLDALPGWLRLAAAVTPAAALATALRAALSGAMAPAALAVLAGFTTFLVRSLGRGEAGGCGCFGTSRPAPVSGVDVARNGLLTLAAVVAAFASGPTVPGPAAVSGVALVAAAGAGGLAVLRRRAGGTGLPAGRQGPRPGTAAPPVKGVRYEQARRTLVAFLAPTCTGCQGLRAAVEARVPGAGDVQVALVELDDASRSTFDAFHVRSAPFLVVVDTAGQVVTGGRATSSAEVQALPDLEPSHWVALARRTRDLGGEATTAEATRAVLDNL